MPYIEFRETQPGLMIVHTVRKQFEIYTNQEVDKSKLSRELQGMFGHPSHREYKDILSNKLLQKRPFTIHDIAEERKKIRPDIEGVRGRNLETYQSGGTYKNK